MHADADGGLRKSTFAIVLADVLLENPNKYVIRTMEKLFVYIETKILHGVERLR